MKHDTHLDRREFTLQAALAMLSGVVISVTGCGSVEPSPTSPSPAPAASGDVAGSVSANHGHTAVITRAQLTAGNGVLLDIMGSADHTHSVELSQSQVISIANGQRVSKASTVDQAHDHTVAFN